jgi:hypothetical protein
MTIKDDVLAAFGRLAPDDDAAWNKDGTPKLEAIRNAAGDQKISRDEMIQSIGDLRRPVAEAKPETPPAAPAVEPPAAPPEQAASQAAPPEDKPDTVNTDKPKVEGVEDIDTPDKTKLVAEAEARIAEIDGEVKKVAPVLNEALAEMQRLQKLRDAESAVVAENTVVLTHAEAVKRVQAQTAANAAANKQRMQIASDVLKSSGFKPAASALDASLAARKRTPEMAMNAAKYHQSRQAERLQERIGQV